MRGIRPAFLGVLAIVCVAPLAAQVTVHTVDNTTSGTVPFVSGSDTASNCTAANGALVRTFSVGDSFTVADVTEGDFGLGLNVSHDDRQQLVVRLVAPNGTTSTLLNLAGSAGDSNFDIMLSDIGSTDIQDGDGDNVGLPYYHRDVDPGNANPFNTFNGLAAQGTWTLLLCDHVSATSGTFHRARLVLHESGSQTSVCAGTVSYDWGSNGDNNPFVSATFSDITLSQVSTNDVFGNALATSDFETETETQGGATGYYNFGFNVLAPGTSPDTNADESSGMIAVFSFDPTVRDLSFDLVDIDFINGSNTSDGGFEDLARIVATDAAGNQLSYETERASANNDPDLSGDIWEGDETAGINDTTNNVTYFIAGPVAELTVEFFQGNVPNDPADQFVGIGDLTLCAYDFGDAPDTYSTTLAGGARHVLSSRQLYLGSVAPDGEGDGQPGAAASTDGSDEDGVASFPGADLSPGDTYDVSVTVTNNAGVSASLCGWIDFDLDGGAGDGTFESDEGACVTVPAAGSDNAACTEGAAGVYTCTVSFTVPADFVFVGGEETYARFRVSTDALTTSSASGRADDGEVEDYQIAADTLPVTLEWVTSRRDGERVVVEWQTATETANVGFYLYGSPASRADRGRLSQLVPSRAFDSLKPQRYRATLDLAVLTAFRLAEVDTRGREAFHGPFVVGESYGRASVPQPIDWPAIRSRHADLALLTAARQKTSRSRVDDGAHPVAELRVDRDGLYRATYEQLAQAGLDFAGAAVDSLALSSRRQGNVALRVVGSSVDPKIFGAGGFIEFLGRAVDDSLYTAVNVYRLEVSPSTAARVRELRGLPAGPVASSYVAHHQIDRNLVYTFASPTEDPWYEAAILAFGSAASRSFPIVVDAVASDEDVRLELMLWGITNWPGSAADHHVVISLNGVELAEEVFDGLLAWPLDLAVPAGVLSEGENTLEVTVPGDTGFDFDLVYVDRYSLSYNRRFAASDGRLDFAGAATSFTVTDLPSADVVVYSDDGRGRLTELLTEPDGEGGYRVTFRGDRRQALDYRVATVDALLAPSIVVARAADPDLLQGRAEYLILTHPHFSDGLEDLVAARERQGLRVKIVDVFDLYQRYAGGVIDPRAIKTYITMAAERLGTRFVLLVGGDTYDYFDRLGIGSMSFVPTPYLRTDPIVAFAPVDPLYGDLDDDGVPELPIGRLPVRTEAELETMITKILAYEQTPAGAVLAADDAPDGRFHAISEDLAAQLPVAWPVTRAYLDLLDVAAARAELLAGLEAGVALVNFVGHSAPTAWTFDGLFSSADADVLTNTVHPTLVTQWGCWNTYHVAPEYDTLGHRLTLAGLQGAAAVIGASTLTATTSDEALGNLVFSHLLEPGITVGEAITRAKIDLGKDQSHLKDVLLGWTLLGDPALRLPLGDVSPRGRGSVAPRFLPQRQTRPPAQPGKRHENIRRQRFSEYGQRQPTDD